MHSSFFAVALAAVTGATLLAATPAASAVGVPSKYVNQQIAWKPCFNPVPADYPPGSERLLCGSFTAPMDWNHPSVHPDITIAVSKLAATGTAKGTVVVNPGGPGAPGRTLPLTFLDRTKLIGSEDIVGFDPRGTGASTNTTCGHIPAIDADDHDRSPANLNVVLDSAQLYADLCHRAGGEFQPFVNTEQTVNDVDLLRALLGRDKINWIGYSGGTWMGAYYATYFPNRVDKVVLDSNTDFAAPWQKSFELQPMAFQRRFDQDFAQWVAKYESTFHLGATAAAVEQAYNRARAAVAAKVITVGNGDYDTSTLDFVETSAMYNSRTFPMAAGLIAGINLVAAGQPVPADLPVPVWTDGPAPSDTGETAPDAENASFWSIQCNDTPYRGTRQALIAFSGVQATKYPLVGYDSIYQPCLTWQRPADLNLRKPTGRGVPPVLMLQNQNDPATPYEGAVDAHNSFANSRLLSVPGQGNHGVYATNGNTCVDNTVESYIVDGVVPAHDLTCPAVPLPGPTSTPSKADMAQLMARVQAAKELRGPLPL
jgi:pimeloyl-ACP methyl ester carboxylesterase